MVKARGDVEAAGGGGKGGRKERTNLF